MAENQYRLLDSGHGRKLEAFGKVVVDRPAPQAVWHPGKDKSHWQEAELYYVRESHGGGHWQPGPNQKKTPDEWKVRFYDLNFYIKPTPFGHMGLFCEQALNWALLQSICKAASAADSDFNVLNLFAYTGAATLFARSGGAKLTHVDSSKSIVAWARRNAELNKLDGIRWLVEDVRKYVSREVRREAKYQGLILDPPTFGRGPKGQVWKIEEHFLPMMDELISILFEPKFVFLSCHSPNFSPLGLAIHLRRYSKLKDGVLIKSEMVVGQSYNSNAEEPNRELMPNGFHCTWLHRDMLAIVQEMVQLTESSGGYYTITGAAK